MRALLVGGSLALGVVLFAGLSYALFETTTVSSITMSADSGCGGGRLSYSGGVPKADPVYVTVVNVTDGARFQVEKPAGHWVAHLAAAGANFSKLSGANYPATPWGPETLEGWCHATLKVDEYVSRGDGTITIRYWLAKDTGFRTG